MELRSTGNKLLQLNMEVMKGEIELHRDKIYFRRHSIEFDDGSNVGNKEKEKLHISTEPTEYLIAPRQCLQEEKMHGENSGIKSYAL